MRAAVTYIDSKMSAEGFTKVANSDFSIDDADLQTKVEASIDEDAILIIVGPKWYGGRNR